MKKLKSVLISCFVFCLVAAVFSVSATVSFAADVTVSITQNDGTVISVTDGEAALTDDDGTVVVDAANLKVTLNNVTAKKITLSSSSNLTVEIEGENAFSDTSATRVFLVSSGDVTVDGNGTLRVEAKAESFYVAEGSFIQQGATLDLTAAGGINFLWATQSVQISDGTLVGVASSYRGISCEGDVVISGGTVDVTASSNVINPTGAIIVTGGNVTVKNTSSNSAFRTASPDGIRITGGVLNLSATTNGTIYASAGPITITGGEITASGTKNVLYGQTGVTMIDGKLNVTATTGNAIISKQDIFISGSADINVVAAKGSGFVLVGDMHVSGGKISGSADGMIYCDSAECIVNIGKEAEFDYTVSSQAIYEPIPVLNVEDGISWVEGSELTATATAVKTASVDWICIDSLEELLLIGQDDAYPLSGSYRLTTDIDLKDVEWTPLGTLTGTFDGYGHVISNMHTGTLENPHYQKAFVWGFFGTVDGGTVKNLAFENVQMYVSSDTSYSSLGAVCGYLPANGGTIENVAVLSGTLHGFTKYQLGVGGIAGATNSKAGSGFTIRNCYNGATVIARTEGGSYAVAGGMIGRAWSYSTRLIENCFNAGYVQAINTGDASSYYNLAGNIISYQQVNDPTKVNASIRNNNYAVAGRLIAEGNKSAIYQHDVDSTTLVNDYNAINAANFSGLTDYACSVWAVKPSQNRTYYYPMLHAFLDHAQEIVADAEVAKAELDLLTDKILFTNTTTESDVASVITPYFPDAQVTLTLNQKADLTADGSWNLKVVVTDDIAVERTVTISKLPSVESFEYTFADAEKGMAEGTVFATLTDAYVHGAYELYWGDESGAFTQYAPLAKNTDGLLNCLVISETSATATIRERVAIPVGATHLWMTADGNVVWCYEIPEAKRSDFGTEKYTFGILSDTHFGYAAAPNSFASAFTHFEKVGAKFVTIAGDFTSHATTKEYAEFKEAYEGVFEIPFFTTLGNHDSLDWNISSALTTATAVQNMMNNVGTYANADYIGANGEFTVTVNDVYAERGVIYDYTVQYGDDLLVFLGIGAHELEQGIGSTDGGENVARSLTEQQLSWLSGVLENSEDYQNVILMFHYPLTQSGITLYRSAEDFKGLYDILKDHPNVIHFSGHTHYGIGDANVGTILSQTQFYTLQDGSYVASQGDLGYTAVHVPSNYDKNTGYVATVYESGVLLTAYNFANDQVIPHATFFVANEEPVKEAEVTLSATVNGKDAEVQLIDKDGTVLESVTSVNGVVSFTTLALEDGVYTYTVKQNATNGGGWYYDQNSYEITVTVQNGVATVEGEAIFTNTDRVPFAEGKIVDGKYIVSETGKATEMGLIKIGDNYYYVGPNGVLVTSQKYYAWRLNEICDINVGWYYFNAEGKLVTDGIVDGYYYENGKPTEKGLFEYEGNYYVAQYDGKIITDRYFVWKIDESASQFATGWYDFNEDGTIIPWKNGIHDGYYYVNDKPTEMGLFEYEGKYYVAQYDGKIITGKYYVWKTQEGLEGLKGWRYFDETTGELLNGVVGEYYYENGKRVDKGLIEWDGSYYFAQSGGKLVTSENYTKYGAGKYYVWKVDESASEYSNGWYFFDENGKLITE